MDVATVLVSAPVGASFGFGASILTELVKRRLGHLDQAETLADELADELVGLVEGAARGPADGLISDIKKLLKLKRSTATKLQKCFGRSGDWPRLKRALDQVEAIIEPLESYSLGEQPFPPKLEDAMGAESALRSAVLALGRQDPIWRMLRGR